MRKLVAAVGLLAVVVTVFAVLISGSADTAEAEGISVDEAGNVVFPQAGHTFLAVMTGGQEVPPVTTSATGLAVVHVKEDFSEALFALRVNDGKAVSAAHIHCAAVGVSGPVVAFLAGDIPGGHNVNGWWIINAALTDANVVNPACGTNLQELAAEMKNGNAYVNVHTVANPGGEIRGQLFMLPAKVESSIVNFNLEDIAVPPGTVVTWTNRDIAPHTTTAGVSPTPSGEWGSSLLSQGQSYSHTFDTPGVFPYFCTIHPFMTATVTVTEATT